MRDRHSQERDVGKSVDVVGFGKGVHGGLVRAVAKLANGSQDAGVEDHRVEAAELRDRLFDS